MNGPRLLIGVAIATLWLPVLTGAQATPSAATLFADAMAKEKAVRAALGGPLGADAVLRAVRTVVTDYQQLVRLHPESAQADDALWHAAALSRDAFAKYLDPQDEAAALTLERLLQRDHPTSPLAKKKRPALAAAARSRPTPARSHPEIVTISGIQRVVVTDAVRVSIALDDEVLFREERLGNPDRYYVDLLGAQLGSGLSDGTMRFDGDRHPVRQIRIGRHPNNVVRVVLEAAGIATCGAYPTYSPPQLVLECVPEGARRTPVVPAVGGAPRPSTPATIAAAEPAPPAETPKPAPMPVPPPPPPPPIVARQIGLGWGRVAPINRPGAVQLSASMAEPVTPVPATPPSRNLVGGFSIARQLGLGVSRIVIDPGHGGQDPGARANGTTEAAIVLDIAFRLEKLFEAVPGVAVILTRRSDVFVPLEERTALANRESADLFLSIHVNGSGKRTAAGVETYFLNFANTQDAAAVAARENAASGQSMAALPDVVKAITLNNKRAESRDLAAHVQRELLTNLRPANRGVKDLGVKQAPFVVLIGAEMPSVLAEVSFLTNAQEARLLKSTNYRQRVAKGLFDAIRKYQTSLKGEEAVALR